MGDLVGFKAIRSHFLSSFNLNFDGIQLVPTRTARAAPKRGPLRDTGAALAQGKVEKSAPKRAKRGEIDRFKA